MSLPLQTITLLQAAAQLAKQMPADAVLLLTETDLDWDEVKGQLPVQVAWWPRVNLVALKKPDLATKDPNQSVLDLIGRPALAYRSRRLFDTAEVKLERAFHELHREIWQMLKDEVLKGYAQTGG